jgi:hypothetical protein
MSRASGAASGVDGGIARSAAARATAPRQARAVAEPAAKPRLTLERAEPAGKASAETALDQIRSEALAVQAAASAAARRVADLEQELGGLRADSAAGQATVAQLRTRIGEAERHSQWLPLLAAAVALLAVAALWLGLRLRALQLERRTLLRQFAASRQPAAESSSFDTSSGFVPARAVQAGLQVAEAPAAVAAALSSVKRPGDLALDSESHLSHRAMQQPIR